MNLNLCRAVLVVELVIGAAPVLAQQTDNYQLRAVPAPVPGVVLDGKLNEWDLSGEILSCYDLDAMRDTNSVRTAAMYDKDYLYLSFRFKDVTPLVNHVNPVNEVGCGWRADSIQLRLWTDHDKPIGPGGGRIGHLDCYWYTDGKRPSAHLTYHDMSRGKDGFEATLPEVIGQGVDAAFAPDADGPSTGSGQAKGYTQEMRVAWKLIRRDGRPYVAGETLRMGIELFWGDPTGSRWPSHRFADLINPQTPQREFFWTNYRAWGEVAFLDQGKLPPSPSLKQLSEIERLAQLRYRTEGPLAIAYDLPAAGYATLAIEHADGGRVRNLIADYPRPAGRNTDFWDGTDDNGRLVEPGEYVARGLTHGELGAQFEFAYGTPGTPPWETSDGRGDWLSDHARPVAVASDGEWVYLAAHTAEGGSTVIGLDGSGQKRWGIGRIAGGMLAVHGGFLYMLAGGGHPDYPENGEVHLLRIDPRAGKLAAFPDGKSDHLAATFPPQRPVKPREWEGALVAAKGFDAEWCQHEALGLAATKDKLYISLFYADKVLVFDPVKGEKTGELALPHPAGLAGDAKGNLYAVSGRQVFRLTEQDEFVPFVTEGLAAPVGLALDAAGNLYVSDWGSAMCVKVFGADGRLRRTIGREGGRPLSGKYDAAGMFRPWGIAVDGKGRLWAAEHDFTPKRLSVWGRNGKLEKEYCGPTWYGATECNVNQLDSRRAFCMGNIVDLDWKKGLWRVAATLWRPTQPEALLGPRGEGLVFEVREIKGRKLLLAGSSGPFFCVSELRKDGARPLMALGSVYAAFIGDSARFPELVARKLWDDPAQLEWARQKYPAMFSGVGIHRQRVINEMIQESIRRGKPARSQFLWTDANGDGLVQDAELRLFTPEEAGGVIWNAGWRFAYGPDLTLYPVASVEQKTRAWRLPLKGWNACGAPLYDLTDARLIADEKPLWFVNSPWADGRGNLLLNQSPLTMLDPQGKCLWTFPNRWPGVHGSHQAPKDRNGLLIGPLKVIGSAQVAGDVGELFCLSGNMGKAFLMTTDGLYVGSLFRDTRAAPDALPDQPRRGMSINRTSPGSEWFGGEFFRNSRDGQVYIGSAARNGSILSRVTGLESIRRLPSVRLTLTQALYDQAAADLAKRPAAVAAKRELAIHPAARALTKPPAATDFSWAGDGVASWSYDTRRSAEATWTFDAQNLYLCFRNVADTTPMVNGGKIVRQLFKTGDAAVCELRTVPDNDTPGVIEGDLRLLFSVFEGKPVTVLYRYKVAGTAKPEEFASPVTTTAIDVVKVLDNAAVAVDRQPGGYTVRVAVPLAELGFAPEPGHRYRGDFGIVHSDAKGTANELRMYWSNQATGLVADLALEAAIEPGRWGTFAVSAK